MVFNKKAISPVVATALLLVVAVVAVVGFQTWFNSYQSDQLVDVEDKSGDVGALTIERVENGSTGGYNKVYIKNTGSTAVTINELKINTCINNSAVGSAAASTVTEFNVSGTTQGTDCGLTQDTSYNVVVVTDNGVVSGKYFAK